MNNRFWIALIIVVFQSLFLSGCTNVTQPSADIAQFEPHPAPIDNFQIVTQGAVYRSGQPKGEAEWAYLKSIGITAVIRLNKFSPIATESQERKMAEKYGIAFYPNYMQPEDWPHNWNLWVQPNEEALFNAVGLLENRGAGKILVHCAHGKDRTGLVVAVYSVRNKNLCKDAAYAQMQHYGASPFLFGVKRRFDSLNVSEAPNCVQQYR